MKERQKKKRYAVTLDAADVEEVQTILTLGLSPSLQYLMNEFLEDWKDDLEETGEWVEPPLTSEQRKTLDSYYKKFPDRFAALDHLPEMKRRRIEKGRFFLLKKEKRYSKKEGGKA